MFFTKYFKTLEVTENKESPKDKNSKQKLRLN